jgi:hypothetical protein
MRDREAIELALAKENGIAKRQVLLKRLWKAQKTVEEEIDVVEHVRETSTSGETKLSRT